MATLLPGHAQREPAPKPEEPQIDEGSGQDNVRGLFAMYYEFGSAEAFVRATSVDRYQHEEEGKTAQVSDGCAEDPWSNSSGF